MDKEELLEKIERQAGYIDVIDAYRLISVYTDEFGILKTTLSVEDELIYMYMKLKGDSRIKKKDLESGKVKICKFCKIEKKHHEFNSYYYKEEKRRVATCKECMKNQKELLEKRQDYYEELHYKYISGDYKALAEFIKNKKNKND